MSLDRLIEQHRMRVRAAQNGPAIFGPTLDAVRELGFNRAAIVHAQWFVRPRQNLLFLHNFDEWGDIFVARGYYRHDPALLTSQRTHRPFTWTEMREEMPPGPMPARILSEAGRHGLRVGLTVPVSVPGEPAGCCTFATDASELPPPSFCRAAAWIADEAFYAARRLHGYPVPIEATEVPHVSARLLECLHWAVIGRTDAQIAIIMGLKITTVRSYMRDLRQMFGVCSRVELARAAQRAGFIGLDDTIPY
ncbi:LuxR family transcriptional regulator [Sphingopyxis sp.]|uniref:helix-turn-helix transcriptional regulator n=1 Tax=Sphingopyxis sp. TaxID=1908224 RepID=UPI00261B0B0D|nr:LuxR family transcriptional regulator [Sphingopyxis sp.]MCW0199898.1 LuxR family transcriptional regulator [Sphingopyxis sp.]